MSSQHQGALNDGLGSLNDQDTKALHPINLAYG